MLESIDDLTADILTENVVQLNKWGVQKRTAFEWMCYLTEEVGELAEAISEKEYRQGTNNQVVQEAIQIATLVLKIAEMYKDAEQAKKKGKRRVK